MRCPSDSIDYAVMEKTDNAKMVPLDVGWSDVGSWQALWEIADKDAADNAVRGDVLLEDARGCYVHSDERLVAAVGVNDLVVVASKDAVLIMPRDRDQAVKQVVAQLQREDRIEALEHCQVARPWGSYEGLSQGERFQVKHIVVKPGGRLSLQSHNHRAEHWIVVSGTAKVTRGEETFLLGENESTYIPLGTRHRLENPGMIPLELIEVQSGSYLGEDDIERYDDVYGR
jgi:mannose-1-phosphate guanylyltransferase/mannose-6-phosphate isomerase